MTETVLLMLIVGTFLVFVNLIAFLMRSSARKAEREKFEAAVRDRERIASQSADSEASPLDPLPVPDRHPPAPLVPARSTPHPKSLLPWKPQGTSKPTHFDRYIAWPNTKLTTPVAERTPSEEDYVWD